MAIEDEIALRRLLMPEHTPGMEQIMGIGSQIDNLLRGSLQAPIENQAGQLGLMPQHTPGMQQAIGVGDQIANVLLNPNSGTNALEVAKSAGEQFAPWALNNMTNAGQALQGSRDIMGAITQQEMPLSDRIAQGLTGAVNMLTSVDPIPTALASKIGSGMLAITVPVMKDLRNSALEGLAKSQGVGAAEGIWGETAPKIFDFQYEDVFPGIKKTGTALKAAKASARSPMLQNDIHRELAAVYNQTDMPIQDVKNLYMNSLNRDEVTGKSAFDQIYDTSLKMREVDKAEFKPYAEGKINVSKGAANEKAEGEYIALDTSRGCKNNCNECYACAMAKKSKIDFVEPTPVELTGNFFDDPTKVRRIGTSGEPSWNPQTNGYDWGWTNQQLVKTGLASPEGQKKTFIITKLNSIDGFDPNIVRNLEVSVDPMNPDHFFQTLGNMEALKKQFPNLNLMMRIRSVSTQSDEINALQQIAVDFANKNRLPVLETRMRFKSGEGLQNVMANPDYVKIGNQFKDTSYYPSEESYQGGTKKIASDRSAVIGFEDHTESGPVRRSTYIKSKLVEKAEEGKKTKYVVDKDKAPVWDVYSNGEVISSGLPKAEALEMGRTLAARESGRTAPTRSRVQEITMEESPLSRFGLNENLHYQCNVSNLGAGACGGCQNCRSFLKRGERMANGISE